MNAATAIHVDSLLDTEQRILGAVFLSAQSMYHLDTDVRLRPEHFVSQRHGHVFAAMRQLFDQHGAFDKTTVRAQLVRNGTLGEAGGDEVLDHLVHTPVTAAGNLRQYAAIVVDAAKRRRLTTAGLDLVEQVKGPDDTDDVVSRIERELMDINAGNASGGLRPILEVLLDEQDKIEKRASGQTEVSGVRTGFTELDDLTGGFEAGQLVIVAGRPAMGKSAFVTNIANEAALHQVPTALFSLEMREGQIAQRLMAQNARVSTTSLRKGDFRPDRWSGIVAANQQLAASPLWIDHSSDLSVSDIRARTRRLAARHDVGLVIVDYLQLIRAEARENRQVAVAEMSRGLKVLADEVSAPVVVLSQLSRQVEGRSDKRPMLSDLRESGAIEQDADVVLALYRDEYYDPDTSTPGIAEVIVLKQREGDEGTVELNFDGVYSRFSNRVVRTAA